MKSGSIQFKFVSATLSSTMVALMFLCLTLIIYNVNQYIQELHVALESKANLIAKGSTASLQFQDRENADSFLTLLKVDSDLLSATLFDEQGNVFATYLRDGFESNDDLVVPDNEGIEVVGSTIKILKYVTEGKERIGSLRLVAEYRISQKILAILSLTGAIFILTSLIAGVISFYLQKGITKPIIVLTNTARSIVENNDFSVRCGKTPKGELGTLFESFNKLLDEVESSSKKLEDSNRVLVAEVQERKDAELKLRKSQSKINELNSTLETKVKERTFQLELANKELESFSYSVSHDLRTPLRAIDGFSQALVEDYSSQLDDVAKDYLHRVRMAAQKMGGLIDDILKLSRVSRADMNPMPINISNMIKQVAEELMQSEPGRKVQFIVEPDITIDCDANLFRIAIDNLLSNAWKYSSKNVSSVIEFGRREERGNSVYFIKDNGVGFDMNYANKLFGAFQRLHTTNDFPGSGIGLATVKRVISRHGGKVWASSEPGKGAEFCFSIQNNVNNPHLNKGDNVHEQQTNINC